MTIPSGPFEKRRKREAFLHSGRKNQISSPKLRPMNRKKRKKEGTAPLPEKRPV